MKIYKSIVIGILLFQIASCFGQEVDIGITKQRLSKIKIGINGFNPEGELSSKLTNVLINDLILVDYFEPIKSTFGVDLILNCTYTTTGGDLTIEGKLYEAKKGTMFFGKRFSGPSNQYRKLVHTLVDNIVTTVTGEKGIAQTKLVFEGVVGKEKQIFVSDYDGANLLQITKEQCPNLLPNWSPDGNKIIYTSYLYGFPQSFIYDVKGGMRKKICGFPGLNTSASFSPDGRKVALTLSKDGNPEIYIIDIDSLELTRVTNDKGIDSSPTWSPDGKKIAFVSNRSGTPQIYIMDIRGGIPKRLTYSGSYNTNPSWSPKGNLIAYNSIVGGRFQIFTIDVNTGDTVQVTNLDGSCENPSFAPDGRHIVFSLTKGYNSSLYIMDIFFMEPHRLEIKGVNPTNPDWGK